jgi:hypothetical protein
MGAWLKTHPDHRGPLAEVSFEAEAVWHIVRLYCADVGNDGKLARRLLPVAVARKISETKARRLAAELVAAGLWREVDDGYELVGWLDEQPAADVWQDNVKRERWARAKALHRDRSLCRRIQERDANLCRYCGVRVDWTDRRGKAGGTYDHVDPDGPNTLENVVVACRACNGRKKDRTPAQAGLRLLSVAELRLRLEAIPPVDDEPVRPPDLARSSSRDQVATRSRLGSRPDSLAHACEAGTNQDGTRTEPSRPGSPPGSPPPAAEHDLDVDLLDDDPPPRDYLVDPELEEDG